MSVTGIAGQTQAFIWVPVTLHYNTGWIASDWQGVQNKCADCQFDE